MNLLSKNYVLHNFFDYPHDIYFIVGFKSDRRIIVDDFFIQIFFSFVQKILCHERSIFEWNFFLKL